MNSDEVDLPGEEIVANSAAAEFCTPQEQLSNFIARQHPIYSEQRLMGFARLLGIHPGIVAGQLRNRTKRFDIFAKHLVKIREIVASAAVTDGYGRSCSITL